jgi:hypothetical protein
LGRWAVAAVCHLGAGLAGGDHAHALRHGAHGACQPKSLTGAEFVVAQSEHTLTKLFTRME